MRSRRVVRALGPFVLAAALALVIDLLAKITSWNSTWTFALAGFGAGLLLILGTPFAFGFRPALQHIDPVLAHEAAVPAEDRYSAPAPSESDLLVGFADGLDEGELSADDPGRLTAGGAAPPSTPGYKLRADLVDVGHITGAPA